MATRLFHFGVFGFSRVTVMLTVSPLNWPTKLCDTSAALIASLNGRGGYFHALVTDLYLPSRQLGAPTGQPLLLNPLLFPLTNCLHDELSAMWLNVGIFLT